ncbi:MAG: potassium transporter KtrB [Ruminococcaceae bacterium]|nr:potassium transporter KtrB [Oscillospiraceae bacterium]
MIAFSFLPVILLGSLLLWLPISSADGESVAYIDALFTATTATCVTGLVTVTTAEVWSYFGQAVILLLIQTGGLGVVTILSSFMMAVRRKMNMSSNLLVADAFNLNTMSGLSEFLKKVLCGTIIIEGIGALLYMTVFVPRYGAYGIWMSVFTSVSAFCNAGIDIIGDNSLMSFATDPVINIVTSMLIILGGIGYIVWWDVLGVIKARKRLSLKHLTLHSKIAISTSLFLIFAGAVCIFAFEYNNPATIGEMSLLDKIQVSLFQSVTTRTAGFASVSQSALTNGSALVSLVLMFIGGSPVGTAGGIKTVTVAVLVFSALSAIKGREQTSMFNRTIAKEALKKTLGVFFTSLFTVMLSTLLMCAVTDASMLDILFETVSATATVGLSRDLTPTLNAQGKLIIILTMYFGRIGPISLALAFNKKKSNQNAVKDPVEDISVG